MPFLWVYSPSDFVQPPPAESGGAAAGTPVFTLTLAAGATPTLVEITDNTDTVFDETGTEETLTNAIDLDGTPYAAGTTIHTSYDLINTGSGHKVTGIHFGGDGFQQGAIQGLASSIELVPGVPYTFNTERTSFNQNNQFTDYFACFVGGTLIETDQGPVPVENLRVGQKVITADGTAKPLRLILTRELSLAELTEKPNLLPVRIAAKALGQGLPYRDLFVSPQHRMVIFSPIAERMFGTDEVFVAAKKLSELPGIDIQPASAGIAYFHLLFDQHEVIFAEGAPTESFFYGKMALAALPDETKQEIFALFPSLLDASLTTISARTIPNGLRQKKLVLRHLKNNKPLLDERTAKRLI